MSTVGFGDFGGRPNKRDHGSAPIPSRRKARATEPDTRITLHDVRCPNCKKLLLRLFVGDEFAIECNRCGERVTIASALHGIPPVS